MEQPYLHYSPLVIVMKVQDRRLAKFRVEHALPGIPVIQHALFCRMRTWEKIKSSEFKR